MKISERDGRLLRYVEMRADEPVSNVAHALGLREHTVRYHLKRFLDENLIISRRPFIDIFRAGLTPYVLYFSLSSQDSDLKDAVIRRLCRMSRVLWVLELGGDYQYCAQVSAGHLIDVITIFNRLALRFGNTFFQKSMTVRTSYTLLGRRYLDPSADLDSEPRDRWRIVVRRSEVEIDELDNRILAGMAALPYPSDRALALSLGIPTATFDRRKKRLEELGVVRGYYYRLNADRLEMQLYKLLITVKGMNPRLSQQLLQAVMQEQYAVYFVECMGTWDYEVGLEVPRPSDVTDITRRLYDAFGNDISSIKEVPIFRYLKYQGYPGKTEGYA